MAGRRRGDLPGILTLLALADEHRGAFEADWRTRFGLPFDVPRSMSWGEAWRITMLLIRDPSSHVCAAVGKWRHPWTWEAMVLADLFDLTHEVAWRDGGRKGSKPKPYPRPWATDTTRRTLKPSVSQERVLEALRDAGHTMPIPTRGAVHG